MFASVFCYSIQKSITHSFQRKKDEKEAERMRKREEKQMKKDEKLRKKKEDRIRKKEEEFRRKKMSKRNQSKYFGQPLQDICPENAYVPLFLTKCINFVEDNGMFRSKELLNWILKDWWSYF